MKLIEEKEKPMTDDDKLDVIRVSAKLAK